MIPGLADSACHLPGLRLAAEAPYEILDVERAIGQLRFEDELLGCIAIEVEDPRPASDLLGIGCGSRRPPLDVGEGALAESGLFTEAILGQAFTSQRLLQELAEAGQVAPSPGHPASLGGGRESRTTACNGRIFRPV